MSFLNNITEVLNEIGKFLFETYAGIGILIASCLLITLIISVILEIKTHEKFKNHPEEEDKNEGSDSEE